MIFKIYFSLFIEDVTIFKMAQLIFITVYDITELDLHVYINSLSLKINEAAVRLNFHQTNFKKTNKINKQIKFYQYLLCYFITIVNSN